MRTSTEESQESPEGPPDSQCGQNSAPGGNRTHVCTAMHASPIGRVLCCHYTTGARCKTRQLSGLHSNCAFVP